MLPSKFDIEDLIFGDCVVRTQIGNWFHAKSQRKRKVAKITLRLCGNLAALRETLS